MSQVIRIDQRLRTGLAVFNLIGLPVVGIRDLKRGVDQTPCLREIYSALGQTSGFCEMNLSVRTLLFLFYAIACSRLTYGAEFVTRGLTVEELSSGHEFTEGPARDGSGGIWFTDIDGQKIHRFDIATGKTELMVMESGGANGLLFDSDGRLLAAEGIAQQLTRRSENEVEVLADRWNGLRLNSPNDLIADANGGIYFTDPDYYHEVQDEGVYYLSSNGEFTQIISDLERPNGIALSPDESTLYVVEVTRSPSVSNSKIWQYDITLAGTISNARIFTTGFADGLTVDKFGNVFGAQYLGVAAWDPDGKRILDFRSPEETTNVVLSDSHLEYPNTLYVTGAGSLYRIELGSSPPGDVDNDGTMEVSDLDTICRFSRGSLYSREYDIDRNGSINIDDITFALADAGFAEGDLNLDHMVDIDDFLILSDSFLTGRRWSQGDLDCNRKVEFADFLALSSNFGSSGEAIATVPEPNPKAIIAILAVMILCVQKKLYPRRQRVTRATETEGISMRHPTEEFLTSDKASIKLGAPVPL